MPREANYGEDEALARLRSGEFMTDLYNVRDDWVVGWFIGLPSSEQWEFLWRLNDEELDEGTLAGCAVALLEGKIAEEYPDREENLRRGLAGANFREMASGVMAEPEVIEWLNRLASKASEPQGPSQET
jgi:hypothetical protein